jgi:hypothetical protein
MLHEKITMNQPTTSASSATAPARSNVAETGCCPRFDPSPFDDKKITWKDKMFVKERVHSVLHVPLDMGRKVTKAMRLIEASHAATERPLMLSEDISPWRTDLYIDVSGPVEGARMATLSGTFLTHVYEGPFGDAPRWCADMKRRVAEKGRTLRKIYFGYTTCPACAKAYGKNYVVLFAEIASEHPQDASSSGIAQRGVGR